MEKLELVETNGLQVLFYNSDFDLNKRALGLRYNENWLKEVVAFGHLREHARLCCLLQDNDAVAISWRDGDLVPALRTKLPAAGGKSARKTIGDPVVLEAEVKAIVIPASSSLDDLFKPEAGSKLFVVGSKGVKEMNFKDGKWLEGEFGGGGGGSGGGGFGGSKSGGVFSP